MPRIARAVVEGIPYHVTQRGNRREDIFFEDENRKKYLEWLLEYSDKHGLKIWAYCLMTNHVHFIVVPHNNRDTLERVMRPLHMRYAQYINNKKRWSGHLWQGRYFSSALDENYLWTAIRYVERNPVRAGLAEISEDYLWSSAAGHCGRKKDEILSTDLPMSLEIEDWSVWLKEPDKGENIDILRRNTQKGLPCGSDSFVTKLERILNRHLRFRPPGRPGKLKEEE
jgi:putative transposase